MNSTNTNNAHTELVSERIRARIKKAGIRFHANDNIAKFIYKDELQALQMEIQTRICALLESMVIDLDNDHNTKNTAKRVAKMYTEEVFYGRYYPLPLVTEFPNIEHINELMIIGPITVHSTCSHHLCPVIGKVWIGVIPNKHSNLIGLSKYQRLIQWVMRRPQIQEEAISQVADLLVKKLLPDGLALLMKADHFCVHWRGVKDKNMKMISSAMRGSFLSNVNLRQEFFALVQST